MTGAEFKPQLKRALTDQPWRQTGRLRLARLGLRNVPDPRELVDHPEDVAKLHSIDVSDNRLRVVPSWIVELPGIRELNLAGNVLTEPEGLAELVQLRRVNLSHNRLTSIRQLQDCTELIELDLAFNRIADLTGILELPRLEILNLAGNALSDVPAIPAPATLVRLNLSANQLTDVPVGLPMARELRWLDVSGNQLGEDAIAALASLRIVTLFLEGNPGYETAPDLAGLLAQHLVVQGDDQTELHYSSPSYVPGLEVCAAQPSEVSNAIDLFHERFHEVPAVLECPGLSPTRLSEVSRAAATDLVNEFLEGTSTLKVERTEDRATAELGLEFLVQAQERMPNSQLRNAAGEVLQEAPRMANGAIESAPPPVAIDVEAPSVTRTAYPRLDAPSAVVSGRPFEITVGVQARHDPRVVDTGAVALPELPEVDFDVAITVDPESFTASGPLRHTLRATTDVPYPFVTVSLTALDGPDLAPQRRIGVHYLYDGLVVGLAWRTITVAWDASELAAASPPEPDPARHLLDLGPLLGQQPPDLILAVHRADSSSTRYVWSAYPSAPGLPVPDSARSRELGGKTAEFARDNRRVIQQEGDPYSTYRWLVGRGAEIAAALPDGVRDVLVRLVEDPARTAPATVLLLTEEVHVPWELAVLSTTDQTGTARRLLGPGGSSPFLGSHVAIGRWLLTETTPRPTPRSEVAVTRQAVITAQYEGVPRWPRLPEAEREADDLRLAYPPADLVQPLFRDVVRLLEGDPPAEVLHLALHGQVDLDGVDEGLVLLAPTGGGKFTTTYLQAEHVLSATMPTHPFVFLNACQVGAGKQVLGDYAGLAAAFLRAGASAVVAPLWNIEDAVASSVARDFYADAYGPDRVPAAEILRRTRARYAEDAFADDKPPPSPTVLAYQLFGHPSLRLRRT